MSVIIRLQNLPWSANALDIRQYFRGLSIPEGGVHIVGGELGDAFIAFSTDEDARQAFQLNNGKIKEVQINLLLSSRTEMQKVIEAARNMQTPFATAIIQQPAVIPPVATVQPIQEVKRDESRDSKSKDEVKSSKSRDRRRSRSRTRSRERKDRSRDRRDRRRRDRSRSRDRRDRRRDRKDRSKSRDRTRSRERDSRRSRDKKRDTRIDDKIIDITNSSSTNIEVNTQPKPHSNVWDRVNSPRLPMPINNNQNPPSLLGTYPGQPNSSLEDARRSLGLVTGLQNILTGQSNILNLPNDNMNGNFQRNDMLKRDNWSMANKNRFPDRNILGMQDKPTMGNLFPPNQSRPMMGQNDMNFGGNQRSLPNMFQSNMGMRMPFNPDMGNNMNRPFLNRPGTLMPDIMQQNRKMQNDFQYNSSKKDIKEEPFRKDNRPRVAVGAKMESCVQLRPYYGGYGDVRRFFHGLHISNSGIKFSTDSSGKRNGTIFVKFVRPDARPQALVKTGNPLRGVVVEVHPLTDEEFDKCGMNAHESDDDKDVNKEKEEKPFINKAPFTCLVVDDIPSFAKEHDILKMFSDYSLLGIHIQSKNRRRMAYVQFNKEEDAAQALGEKNKQFLGGKPITVRPCTDKQFAEARSEQEEIEKPVVKTIPAAIELKAEIKDDVIEMPDQFTDNAASFDTDVILLTGMPNKTTDRDVIDFFSDIGLVPTRIHMLINKFGPSGECYCEFSNPDEAIAALDKNGMPLGAGIVAVEPFPRREMERNLGLNANAPPMNHLPNNRFLGRLGPRPGIVGPRPLMPNNMMRHPHPMGRFDGPHEGNIGAPGCILAMENVPFKAGVDEILDFFENFDVSNHNVLRRYNDNGTPTGDARVTFSSPSEAHRAFEECRFKKIRDRTIFLRVV